MKTTVKFFVILFALAMQVYSVYADNKDNKGTPVTVKSTKDTPTVSGNIGPISQTELLSLPGVVLILELSQNFLVAGGTISFALEEESTVSLADLPDGIYTLSITCDGKTYEGEFGLEE